MTATANRTYYHKVQDLYFKGPFGFVNVKFTISHRKFRSFGNRKNVEMSC
jgi:hypothetical protein